MASCGSEEEQSSCCPRGYIASGPSSLALRGYIHWRSQRPASTPSCGRHSKGQRRRRFHHNCGPAPGPAPVGPRRRAEPRAPLRARPQPVLSGGSSVRGHTALGAAFVLACLSRGRQRSDCRAAEGSCFPPGGGGSGRPIPRCFPSPRRVFFFPFFFSFFSSLIEIQDPACFHCGMQIRIIFKTHSTLHIQNTVETFAVILTTPL